MRSRIGERKLSKTNTDGVVDFLRTLPKETVVDFRLSNFTLIFVYFSSLLNPLLYCWRIKEIKMGVKNLVEKLLCKQAAENEE